MIDDSTEDDAIDIERFNDPLIKPVRDELAMLRYEAVEEAGFDRALFILRQYDEHEAHEALIKYSVEQYGDEDEVKALMDRLCDYCKKSA